MAFLAISKERRTTRCRHRFFLADITEKAVERIIAAVEKMPEDKQIWSPTLDGNSGRSAKNLLCECIVVNTNWADTLTDASGKHSTPPDTIWGTLDDKAKAPLAEIVAVLRGETTRLAGAIRELSDDAAMVPMESDWFGGMPQWEFASFPSENMNYHYGQINYIQVLYGDNHE